MKRKLSPWCKEVKKTLIDRDMSVTELCGEVGDSSKKECIVYLDGSEFEKVTFAAGAEEATALKEAFASSKNFVVDWNFRLR